MAVRSFDAARIEREAHTCSQAKMAEYLRTTVGSKITAYVCGLRDPRMISQWIQGGKSQGVRARRLQEAYEAVRLLEDAYGPETAVSWLFGCNTQLDNEAPAYILRYAKTFDAMRAVVPAARSFIASDS